MIHMFVTFSDDPSGSPLAVELRRSGVPHRLFGRSLSFRYAKRWQLMLFGWTRQLWFAWRLAWLSLFRSENAPPDVVIFGSDIEVFVFSIAGLVSRHRPSIVLLGFIYTPRPQALMRLLRSLYFRSVFALTDKVICHSQSELQRYAALFPGAAAKFRYIPYGMYVSGEEAFALSEPAPQLPPSRIFSAGRSSRDYTTLAAAVAADKWSTHVICDRIAAVADIDLPDNVTVLGTCYGQDYVDELIAASVVVIPLSVDDISAGQMVLIQAMAYQKPIIITRTTTIKEYVQDEVECLLVERGDTVGLRNAIQRLMDDPEFARSLARRGRAAYEQRFCMRAYVGNLIEVCQEKS